MNKLNRCDSRSQAMPPIKESYTWPLQSIPQTFVARCQYWVAISSLHWHLRKKVFLFFHSMLFGVDITNLKSVCSGRHRKFDFSNFLWKTTMGDPWGIRGFRMEGGGRLSKSWKNRPKFFQKLAKSEKIGNFSSYLKWSKSHWEGNQIPFKLKKNRSQKYQK